MCGVPFPGEARGLQVLVHPIVALPVGLGPDEGLGAAEARRDGLLQQT